MALLDDIKEGKYTSLRVPQYAFGFTWVQFKLDGTWVPLQSVSVSNFILEQYGSYFASVTSELTVRILAYREKPIKWKYYNGKLRNSKLLSSNPMTRWKKFLWEQAYAEAGCELLEQHPYFDAVRRACAISGIYYFKWQLPYLTVGERRNGRTHFITNFIHDSSVTKMGDHYVRVDDAHNWVIVRGKLKHKTEITLIACKQCGTSHESESLLFGLCSNCHGVHESKLELASYSERATSLGYFKGKGTTRLFGVELEYESSDVKNSTFLSHFTMKDFVITKRDGSINNGLEIVTAPATKDILYTHLQKFFASREEHPSFFKTAANVGMHVHVGRGKKSDNWWGTQYNDLSYLTVGKMLEFMQNPANKGLIERVAERAGNNYCINGSGHKLRAARTGTGNRYTALNLQNRDTVEFRIFATPTTFVQAAKNIEFCDAVVDFSRSVGVRELTDVQFTNFVAQHRGVYPHLNKFLTK